MSKSNMILLLLLVVAISSSLLMVVMDVDGFTTTSTSSTLLSSSSSSIVGVVVESRTRSFVVPVLERNNKRHSCNKEYNNNLSSLSLLKATKPITSQDNNVVFNNDSKTNHQTNNRRDMIQQLTVLSTSAILFGSTPLIHSNVANAATSTSSARKRTTIEDGNLPDLPPEAQRSYMQYRAALQTSADYYIFELQDSIKDIDQWGDINQLFTSSGARGGQGQPNRIERDYINPMRILELSMPPDESDSLRDARYKFERAMSIIQKAISGVKRDLPVEIMPEQIQLAKKGWEDGRIALNEYFVTLNKTTGLDGELRTIPPSSNTQINEYGRSQRQFYQLMKQTKLCQNRGGTTLANTWGGLMISGYMQDSCGIPDVNEYFFQ